MKYHDIGKYGKKNAVSDLLSAKTGEAKLG